LNAIPRGHSLEFDYANSKARICGVNAGPLGVSDWVGVRELFDNDKNKKSPFGKHGCLSFTDSYAGKVLSNFYNSLLPEDSRNEEDALEVFFKKEIPVMVTSRGEVVCIPIENDCPVIAIVGERRNGKSFFMHRLVDYSYWYVENTFPVVINDSLRECDAWNLPWRSERAKKGGFYRQLRTLNEGSRPLPCVYLHPSTNTLSNVMLEKKGVGFVTPLPFAELIENYNLYLSDNDDYKLGKSGRYFRNMKDALVGLKNIDEIHDFFDDLEDRNKVEKNIPEGVLSKIRSILVDIFNLKLVDNSVDLPSLWTMKLREGFVGSPGYPDSFTDFPHIVSLMAGLVPVFETSDLVNYDFFSQWMRWIVDTVYQRQTNNVYFINNKFKVWLFCDEITSVAATDRKGAASKSFKLTVQKSGPARIGFIYATQNYSKVEREIRSNTTHCFSVLQGGEEEANLLRKDFVLSNADKRQLLKLDKFDIMAMTKHKFIVYSPDGRRRVHKAKDGVLLGKSLPPLSYHKGPGDVLK